MLFGRNLLNFLTPFVDKENKEFNLDWDDEVVKGTLVTKDGKVVNDRVVIGAQKLASRAKTPVKKRVKKEA